MTEMETMVYDSKGSYPKVTPAIYTHNRQILKAEAEFAKMLIVNGNILASKHEKNGNIKTSYQLPPAELVERACAVAELAFAGFAKRGWIVLLPSISEMQEEIKAQTDGDGHVGFLAREVGQNGKAHPSG